MIIIITMMIMIIITIIVIIKIKVVATITTMVITIMTIIIVIWGRRRSRNKTTVALLQLRIELQQKSFQSGRVSTVLGINTGSRRSTWKFSKSRGHAPKIEGLFLLGHPQVPQSMETAPFEVLIQSCRCTVVSHFA